MKTRSKKHTRILWLIITVPTGHLLAEIPAADVVVPAAAIVATQAPEKHAAFTLTVKELIECVNVLKDQLEHFLGAKYACNKDNFLTSINRMDQTIDRIETVKKAFENNADEYSREAVVIVQTLINTLKVMVKNLRAVNYTKAKIMIGAELRPIESSAKQHLAALEAPIKRLAAKVTDDVTLSGYLLVLKNVLHKAINGDPTKAQPEAGIFERIEYRKKAPGAKNACINPSGCTGQCK